MLRKFCAAIVAVVAIAGAGWTWDDGAHAATNPTVLAFVIGNDIVLLGQGFDPGSTVLAMGVCSPADGSIGAFVGASTFVGGNGTTYLAIHRDRACAKTGTFFYGFANGPSGSVPLS